MLTGATAVRGSSPPHAASSTPSSSARRFMRPMTVACSSVITDEVRRHCAEIAANARHVRIDLHAGVALGGKAGLDAQLHFLEGSREAVARYIFNLDAINFGSGWFDELGVSTDSLTERLTAHAREHGPWTPAQLRALDAAAVADTLSLPRAPELTALYANGLNQLGAWFGEGSATAVLGDSAEDLARRLTRMPYFDDRGFYKRAQITANDLHLAGVADFADVDRLTIFADNLVPHVLRLDRVLVYSDELAAKIDAGEPLEAGSDMERELRACAVHACEALAQRAGVPPRTLDNRLWNRGQLPPYSTTKPHITRTVFY